jgi:hypothetical protein
MLIIYRIKIPKSTIKVLILQKTVSGLLHLEEKIIAGSHEGAELTAMIYTFRSYCKINNIETYAWLRPGYVYLLARHQDVTY